MTTNNIKIPLIIHMKYKFKVRTALLNSSKNPQNYLEIMYYLTSHLRFKRSFITYLILAKNWTIIKRIAYNIFKQITSNKCQDDRRYTKI